MSRTYDEVKKDLDTKLSSNDVSEREGGGRKLSYVSSFYVIDQLNVILGQGNWSYDTQEMRLVSERTYTKKDYRGNEVTEHSAHYIAKCHLIATIGDKQCMLADYGYGDGTDKNSPGKAHELAVKEAATDALKRCAKNLGMKLGLALYDKEQTNVEDEPAPKANPAPRVSPSTDGTGGSSGRPNPVATAPKKEPVGATVPSGSAPSGAPQTDRKKVNAAITAASKILLAQEKMSMTDLKQMLKDAYQVASKEELTDAQAQEFLAKLEEKTK